MLNLPWQCSIASDLVGGPLTFVDAHGSTVVDHRVDERRPSTLTSSINSLYSNVMASLPSYLTSGASSRAHHAFLVKLHRAQSDQEEDEVIRHEVQRGKKQLGVRGGASLVCTPLFTYI